MGQDRERKGRKTTPEARSRTGNRRRERVKARYFHVVGGGCFGTQYVRWLLRAHQLGMVEFEKIFVIDQSPQCQLVQEGFLQDSKVQLITQDWVDYFSDYLIKHYQDPAAALDHWVPAPLSPPILFLGFLRAASQVEAKFHFEPDNFRARVSTPVQISLESGSLAVSFAEWQCPVNCIEPPRCPAIHEERTWDMKPTLEQDLQFSQTSSHVLQCQHLVHGVGTIPCQKIFSEFQRCLKKLREENCHDVVVATVSGCHGLIGRAKVNFTNANERPQSPVETIR